MKFIYFFLFFSLCLTTTAQTLEYVYPESSQDSYDKEYVVPDYMPLNFYSGSLETALEIAKQERKLIFLDFYADWCGPCKQIEAEVFVQPEFYEYVNENYIVVKIYGDNFDSGGFDYAQDMGVEEWPTLMVINSDGDEMGRISGYKTMNTYLLELKRLERFSAYKR